MSKWHFRYDAELQVIIMRGWDHEEEIHILPEEIPDIIHVLRDMAFEYCSISKKRLDNPACK